MVKIRQFGLRIGFLKKTTVENGGENDPKRASHGLVISLNKCRNESKGECRNCNEN